MIGLSWCCAGTNCAAVCRKQADWLEAVLVCGRDPAAALPLALLLTLATGFHQGLAGRPAVRQGPQRAAAAAAGLPGGGRRRRGGGR